MRKCSVFIITASATLALACSSNNKKNRSETVSNTDVNAQRNGEDAKDGKAKNEANQDVTFTSPLGALSLTAPVSGGDTIQALLPQSCAAYEAAIAKDKNYPDLAPVNKALQAELPNIGIKVIVGEDGKYILKPEADENGLISNPFTQEIVKAGQSGVEVTLMDNTDTKNNGKDGVNEFMISDAYIFPDKNYAAGKREDNLSDYFAGSQLGTDHISTAVINPLIFLGLVSKQPEANFSNPLLVGTMRHEIGVHGAGNYDAGAHIYNPFRGSITGTNTDYGDMMFEELPGALINLNTLINSSETTKTGNGELLTLVGQYSNRVAGMTDTMYSAADYVENIMTNPDYEPKYDTFSTAKMYISYSLKDGSEGKITLHLPQLNKDSTKEEARQAGLEWAEDMKVRCVWADENLEAAHKLQIENGVSTEANIARASVQGKQKFNLSKDKYDENGSFKEAALSPKGQAKLAQLKLQLPPEDWAPISFLAAKPITHGSLGIAELGKIFDSMNRSEATLLSVNEAMAQANLGILKDDFKLFSPESLSAAQHSIDVSLGSLNDFESSNISFDVAEQNSLFSASASFLPDFKFNLDGLFDGIQNSISYQTMLDVIPFQFSDLFSGSIGASLGAVDNKITNEQSNSVIEAAKRSGISTTDVKVGGKSYTKISLPIWFGGVTLRLPHQ